MNELTEVQKKMEKCLNELAEAQKKKKEKEIAKPIKTLSAFKKLSEEVYNSFCYSLGNAAYRALPQLLKERYGIEEVPL